MFLVGKTNEVGQFPAVEQFQFNSLAFVTSCELSLGHSPFLLHLLCHNSFQKSSFHYLKPKVIRRASQPDCPALMTHLSKMLDQC